MSTQTDEQRAREQLIDLAAEFYDQFAGGQIPEMTLPTRTKSNIEYDKNSGVWVYGDRTSSRSANSVRGARKLLKAVYTIEFLANQLDEDRSSTLRELYYLSESWDNKEAHFSDQDESNQLIEDLEIVSKVTREDFHMRPEESGATLMGPLLLREQTRRGEREIHCQKDVGEGGYQIPNNPDTIEFLDAEIDFVLCVETGGMRDRLIENGFDEQYNCLVVHLKGQPARATRRIIKRLHDELDLPITVFCDGDPWSYRIYGSGRVWVDQVGASLGVSGDAGSRIHRNPAQRHRRVRPADRSASGFGYQRPRIRTHGSALPDGVLDRTDRAPA